MTRVSSVRRHVDSDVGAATRRGEELGDQATLVDGGMIAFAAGRLAPGQQIILCGHPDFALLSRAWVLDQTPGVKIWFHDSRRPIRYRELFADIDQLP